MSSSSLSVASLILPVSLSDQELSYSSKEKQTFIDSIIPYFFSYKTGFFVPSKTISNLDPSYKMDLDFGIVLEE